MKVLFPFVLFSAALVLVGCNRPGNSQKDAVSRIPVIFDTDANNELDDQHALAYLLLNDSVFDVVGITVNATYNGGDIEQHYLEADRVIRLSGWNGKVPLLRGANGSFGEIRERIGEPGFDGEEAVDFIIREAEKERDQPLVLLPVGKLTNVALALLKQPSLAGNVRVVWLGSNYPDPGEYNQDNDTAAMNYILETAVPFEMVTVRGGNSSGTAAVTVTQKEISVRMPGLGPKVDEPVTGRHGGSFTTFGDYSVNLFEHIDYYDEQRSRALFDMAAVAIVKDPSWADRTEIPAPLLVENRWIDRPGNERTITVWENFDKERIIRDFYSTLER
jgi:purine nucleosidase